MAKYWRITLGGDYVADGEGDSFSFVFPQNTGATSKTYNIVYEDESGFTAVMEYVLTACPVVTTCYVITSTTNTLSSSSGNIQLGTSTAACADCGSITHSGTISFTSGGTYNGTFSYTPTACTPSISNLPSWVNYLVASGGSLVGSASVNGTVSSRSATITFNGESINVTQSAGAVQHSCSDITISPTVQTVGGSSKSNWTYTTWTNSTLPSDFATRSVVYRPNWVTSATATGSSLILSYSEFSDLDWANGKGGSDVSRSSVIRVKFKNLINSCTNNFKLSQTSCSQFVCLKFDREIYNNHGGADFYIFDETFGDTDEETMADTISNGTPFASTYNWGNRSPLLTYKFNSSTNSYVNGSMVLQPNLVANVIDEDWNVGSPTAMTITTTAAENPHYYVVIAVSADRQKVGRFKQGGNTSDGEGASEIHGLFKIYTDAFNQNGLTLELTNFSDGLNDY